MATTQIVNLFDDLDSRIQSGVETVTFFDPSTGEKLEIELGEANRKHFANHVEKLAKYIAAARKVEVATPAKPAAKADGRNAQVRAWAQANGFQIGDRGRIKAEIVEAYDKAHTEAVKAPESAPEAVTEPVATQVEAEPVEASVSVTDGVVDASDLVEVESPQDAEPTEAELAKIENSSDPTDKFNSDEFTSFLRDNMDEHGNVSAAALAKVADSE